MMRVDPMSSTGHFLNEGETIFPEKLLTAAAAALDAAKKKVSVLPPPKP